MVIALKIVGTIVEYNPLHNGHVYAINKIKEESKADVIIAVMSGDFTMRGELSLFNKFEKTDYALKAGIDLIIELPFVYTVHNADNFAKYSVKLLNEAKVDEIWIGSEGNDSSIFEQYYQKWNNPENQKLIKDKLDQGLSYKAASSEIINLPSNDLLGFSYFKAIKELKLDIKLNTIQRIGTGYYDEAPNIYASAYAIRKNHSLIKDYCPSYLNISNIRNEQLLFDYLKYRILSSSTMELKNIFLVDEGLENKLNSINNYQSYDDFVASLTNKRYTKSRIQRMLAYILFNIDKDTMQQILNDENTHIRVLGYSNKGLNYLRTIKKQTTIYTNIKNEYNQVLDITLKISKILDHIYNTNQAKLEAKRPIEKVELN